MALVNVEYSQSGESIPEAVVDFLREATLRVNVFVEDNSSRRTGFVPSDYVSVYRILRALTDADMIQGNAFCEWGSGFGVVASLAAMLGFDASGIELETQLVDASRLLAKDFDLSVDFVHGSFFPAGAEVSVAQTFADTNGEYFWLLREADDGYDQLQLAIDSFDIIFAYPWPGEEYLVERLFEEHAAHGTLLLMCSDVSPTSVRQKVG